MLKKKRVEFATDERVELYCGGKMSKSCKLKGQNWIKSIVETFGRIMF